MTDPQPLGALLGNPSADRDQRILELQARGLGRNAIVKAMAEDGTPVGAGTITKVVQEAGRSFDRAEPAQATAARKADARARRERLHDDYLREASRLLKELRKPTLVFSFGGKENEYNEHTLPEADAHTKLKLVQASTMLADRAMRLAEADSDSGVEAGRSMLGALAGALKLAHTAATETTG